MALLANDTNPMARFEDILKLAKAGAAALPPEVQPPAILQVIQQERQKPQGQQDVGGALATHLALHTGLDQQASRALVAAALPADADPQAQASAVSTAAAAAVAASGEVQLSDPVMLWPIARVIFAGLLVAALAMSIIFTFILANGSSTVPGGAYASLSVSGALTLIGVLVLVMGYKNVTIKGGPPSSG